MPSGRFAAQASWSARNILARRRRHPEIFAIGDCISKSWEGKPAPGMAPAAKQMGRYTAAVIRARVEGASPPPHSVIDIRAVWQRSGNRRFRWMTLLAASHGSFGPLPIFIFSSASARASSSRSIGCGPMSPFAEARGSFSPKPAGRDGAAAANALTHATGEEETKS
jgi:hypothetical protein